MNNHIAGDPIAGTNGCSAVDADAPFKAKNKKLPPKKPSRAEIAARKAEIATLRAAPPRLLTRRECAFYTTLSLRTIAELIAKRKLKTCRVLGRTVLRLADVDEFVAKLCKTGAREDRRLQGKLAARAKTSITH